MLGHAKIPARDSYTHGAWPRGHEGHNSTLPGAHAPSVHRFPKPHTKSPYVARGHNREWSTARLRISYARRPARNHTHFGCLDTRRREPVCCILERYLGWIRVDDRRGAALRRNERGRANVSIVLHGFRPEDVIRVDAHGVMSIASRSLRMRDR